MVSAKLFFDAVAARTRFPLTLALSHEGRGDYRLPLGSIPSPLVGEGTIACRSVAFPLPWWERGL